MGAGTLNAEPRSTSDSVRIDTLSTAVRQNVKDCSEAVAGANLPNAILTGCNLTERDLIGVNLYGATLTDANLSGREPDLRDLRREPDRREPEGATLRNAT